MAEPIGVASGLVALSAFTVTCVTTLLDTIQSFKQHPSHVKNLKEELQSLDAVLKSLQDTVENDEEFEIPALAFPVLQCGKACHSFQQELLKRCSRSAADRNSFRDWFSLTYLGKDVRGFKELLASYKATIAIALNDASFRNARVTAEHIQEQQGMIKNLQVDLQARLDHFDRRLESTIGGAVTESETDAEEMQLMQEERLSTQRCLDVCIHLSEHINEIVAAQERDQEFEQAERTPRALLSQGLRDCKNDINATIERLELRMQNLVERMVGLTSPALATEEQREDLARLKDEWKTARQCREICSRADEHLSETRSSIDNYATGNAIQFMVSTDGTILRGRNEGLGSITRQVGGHLSDVSLQQLSRDIVQYAAAFDGSSDSSQTTRHDVQDSTSEFGTRYGEGRRVHSKSAK